MLQKYQGLFLNLGLFVCANLYPEDFEKFHQEAEEKGIHLRTIIEEKLRVKISKLSYQIAEQWKLPTTIISNINNLSLIEKKLADPSFDLHPLAVVSHLSTMAADVYFGSSTIVSIEQFKNHLQVLMDKDEDAASEILVTLSEQFNEMTEVLNLELPKQSCYTEVLKKANVELLKINERHEQMYKELSEKNQQMLKLSNELDKKNKVLNKLVTTDPLTSLYNRRFFVKNLDRLFAEADRYKKDLSLIILDIDFFKKVNDNYGHQAGDEVLRKVASTIQNSVRKCDICARYGGEFIIILQETPLDKAKIVAEKVRENIEAQAIHLGMLSPPKDIKVTSSFGVASYVHGVSTPDLLVQDSDKFLYQAKESGPNCVRP